MINNDDMTLNELALYFLLEFGRQKLQNPKEFSKLVQRIEKSPRTNFTTDYQKRALEQSRNFANLYPNDLYKYIKKEIPIVRESKNREVR